MVDNIKGVGELKKGLSELDSKLRKTILIKAFNKAADPIIESAKQKAWTHQITGRLVRSLGTKADRANDLPMLILGARMFGKFKGNYAHLLENGTIKRYYRTKKGKLKSTGRVNGIKYWDNSINENETNLQENLPTYIINEMDKALKRMIKRIK